MKLWSSAAKHELDALPRPLEVASTHVPGPHPLRVLIMGTGIAMGYGVLNHDLAVPGHLGRQISAATGRGVDVDVFAELEMTPSRCREMLLDLGTSRYDAIILMIGMWDCFTVAPTEQWGADFDALIDDLHFRTPIGQDVFVVSVPPSPLARMVAGAPRWVIDFHADELNEQLGRVCALHPTVTMIQVCEVAADDVERHRSSQTYRAIAERIAPALTAAFTTPGRPRLRMLDRIDEAHRQEALDRLNIVDTAPEERFDRIVVLAQRMFGTASAAVSFIDGNRQWFKAKRGVDFDQTLRRDAFCDVTIAMPGALVVEDATMDVRFMENPMVLDDTHIRFYAGFPIEAPDGERVGTMCIFDTEPREFTEDDIIALRSIAMLVQDELWATPLVAPV